MLTKIHLPGQREALICGVPGTKMVAAVLDLEAFGLMNEALGPHLAHLVLDLVSGALATRLEEAAERRRFRLWTLPLGDEHYLFASPEPGREQEVVEEIEALIQHVAYTLDNSFAPIRFMIHGVDNIHLLPAQWHEALGRLGALSTSVSPDGTFDGLIRLPPGVDVRTYTQGLDRGGDVRFSCVPHHLARAGSRRLPFPRMRLAVAIAEWRESMPTAGEALDFLLQELARTIDRMRRDGGTRMRRRLQIDLPDFRDTMNPRSAASPRALPSIRQLEKDISQDVAAFDNWQLVLVRPTWRADDPRGANADINSLRELVAQTNPGFADRFLACQHAALAGQVALPPGDWKGGVAGRTLLLVGQRAALSSGELMQRLGRFRETFRAGGIGVARHYVRIFAGHAKPSLLRAMACAQVAHSSRARPEPGLEVELAVVDERATRMFELGLSARRAAAFCDYERRYADPSAKSAATVR